MNFVKYNWVFLIFSLVALAAMGVMGFMCASSSKELKKKVAEAAQTKDYIEGVVKKGYRLNQDNIEIAEKNSEVADAQLKAFNEDLKKKFKLEYEVEKIPLEAIRRLKDELEEENKFLEEAGVEYDEKLQYFTFEDFATTTNPKEFTEEMFDKMFRQLVIIKQVLKTVADAKITRLEDIVRPMNLEVQEEGDYTMTPVEITVTASPDKVQNFVNLMNNTDGHFLFFLRNVEIKADDVMTEVGTSLGVDTAPAATARDGAGDMMGGAGDDNPGGGRRFARRNRNDGRNMAGAGDDMAGRPDEMQGERQNNDEFGLVEVPMRRQDLLVFDSKETTWVLRYDLIEFVQASSEDSEDKEEEN